MFKSQRDNALGRKKVFMFDFKMEEWMLLDGSMVHLKNKNVFVQPNVEVLVGVMGEDKYSTDVYVIEAPDHSDNYPKENAYFVFFLDGEKYPEVTDAMKECIYMRICSSLYLDAYPIWYLHKVEVNDFSLNDGECHICIDDRYAI